MQGKPFDNNTKAFLALVRAGIWESEVQLLPFGEVDYSAVLRLAEEQSVVGLVAAGLEHVDDVKVRKEYVLQFVGQTLQLEQRNTAMNNFIGVLVEKMRETGIYTILVKGQGVAQCYERPLWRASGDVDFLLSPDNYRKAKQFLLPLSSSNKQDERYSKHLGLTIDPWYVEIHGSLRTGLSTCLDKEIDKVQGDVFIGGNVRSWMNGSTTVFLPSPNNDVFFVFTHFIKHFYKEGMSIQQICDLCRLLWTYKGKVDVVLLKERLQRAGLVSEWKAFASLSVDYLGLPVEAMPFYDDGKKWSEKGNKIIRFILNGYSGSKVKDTYGLMKILPWKTMQYLPSIFLNVNGFKIKERFTKL